MGRITGLGKDALPEASGSLGIARHLAFKGDGFLVVRSRVEPGVSSGWHHHGDYDVCGYLVSGTVRFENGPGGSRRCGHRARRLLLRPRADHPP
jgi:quercetin dioxygenase-like cupin family protein